MSPVCCAFAYATELSLSTFSATAALIGAATFALISDLAARSGSSSPAIALSSSWVSCLYSWGWLPIRSSSFALRRLVDRDLLLGVRPGDRTVRQDVGRDGGVDRDRQVGVDQRHRRALRQLLAGELAQLFARQLPILLRHASLLSSGLFRRDRQDRVLVRRFHRQVRIRLLDHGHLLPIRERFPVRLSQLLVGELLFTFRLVGHDCSLPRPVSTAWRPRCCGCSRGSSGTVPPRLRPRRR